MPSWLMKTGPDTYRVWSTNTDEWESVPLDRDQALAEALTRAAVADEAMSPEHALHIAQETLRFVDAHLCSCRARLGETIEMRGGRPIARGGGRLAYHFDSYEQVAEYCSSQAEKAADG